MTADILSSIAAELRVEVSRLEAQALGSLRDPMNLGGVVAEDGAAWVTLPPLATIMLEFEG